MLPNHDAIEKMTLHWRGQADQAYVPATQMRVERRFAELNFSPPGLPPNAVLFIRSIRSRSPLASLDFIPQEWEAEIRGQIIVYYRQAVHPIYGFIPPTAESIIFVDQAEMLTALTVAVIAGEWWSQWPWSELIPMLRQSDALSSAWVNYIQYLPTAFSQLKPSQMAAAVRLLTPAALNQVIQALRSAYDVPEISREIASVRMVEPGPPRESQTTDNFVEPAAITPVTPTANYSPNVDTIEAPWARWLPAALSHSNLSKHEYYLLGLLIGLRQSPAYLRGQSFTIQTARWLLTEVQSVPAVQPPKPRLIITEQHHDEQPAKPTQPTETNALIDEALSPEENAIESLPDEVVSPSPVLQEGIWTQYSGILYLINLLGWLEMPHQWDEALTEHVSSWGLVEILARALLPAEFFDPHDAIWNILAALDNRDSGKRIGAELPPQTTFQLPASVLRRFAPVQPRWRAVIVGDHLRLLDDTDLYLIAEQPLNGRDAVALVESLLAEYQAAGITAAWIFADDQPDELLSPFVTRVCSPALQMWLRRVIGFIRYWLRQIADLSPPELLHIVGRIAVTFTHVDLFMAMETTDIRIRKVGLDRNPGWMPDFGYIIYFHFDE